MQIRAIIFFLVAAVGVQMTMPPSSIAEGDGWPPRQAGEDRWVPSLVLTAGATIQQQEGAVTSLFYDALSDELGPLRDPPSANGDDVAVSPFVGVALELMTPALPIPTRPRFFVSAEILPTFAASRELAIEGDPQECVRNFKVNAPCVKDEDEPLVPGNAVEQEKLRGDGSRTTATVDTLVFGANMGVSFPLQFRERQIRIKPSVAWISYKVDATGRVVAGQCEPVTSCTDLSSPFIGVIPGDLREIILTGSASQRFNGVGPGLDIELDVGAFGPIGAALFLGARAYAIMGDRTISFSSGETTYDDAIGTGDEAEAFFDVEVDPWMYRAHVGIRFQWLGGKPW